MTPIVLQIVGILAVVVGVGCIYWPAALILAGLVALIGGYLLEERPHGPTQPPRT